MNRPLEMLKELDEAKAPDSEYRACFSSWTRERLKRGETWRDRLVRWAEYEEAALARREQLEEQRV